MRLTTRKAVPGDGARIEELVRAVYAAMPEDEKIWFSIDGIAKDAASIDRGDGVTEGYLAVDEDADGTLAAVFTVVIPGLGEDNMGRYAGLSEEQLLKLAHMDTAAVLPAYRGQGLQRRLMEEAERELSARGFRYFACTVHPDNPYSHHNVEKLGYHKIWQGEKYGGKLRDVMLKTL